MNPSGTRRNIRSYPYVPGDTGSRLDFAESRGADAVIADLEDSVSFARKTRALEDVLAWLNSDQLIQDTTGTASERWVRVSAGAAGLRELDQLAHGLLRGVVLPKITSAAELAAAHEVITAAERRCGLIPGRNRFYAAYRNGGGRRRHPSIARASRVLTLQLGEVDLSADLGIEPSPDDEELATIRSNVVIACRATGLAPPIGPASINYSDMPLYRASTELLRRQGLVGRVAIHPAQLPIIHDTYTLSSEEIEAARMLIDTGNASAEDGRDA